MDPATRALVRTRAGNRCEYCLIHQDYAELSHHVEHIVAIKHGGSDDPSNLCLACERCNLFKGSDLSGFDSVTGLVERLFNPREQAWADHFELQGPLIVGRTPTGRATVPVLSMNAGQRLQLRGASWLPASIHRLRASQGPAFSFGRPDPENRPSSGFDGRR